MEVLTAAGTEKDPCGDQVIALHHVDVVTWHRVAMVEWCWARIGNVGWDYWVTGRDGHGMHCRFTFDRQEDRVMFQLAWCWA